MDYGRLFIDSSTSPGNMLFIGNNNPSFQAPRTLRLNMEESPARKRPYFTTSSDEFIYDEEFYNDQLPEKKRRLTPEQVHMLDKSFEEENKLEPERKSELAKKLGLQPRQVAVWFQNRRARSKTKQIERDYDLLKASYDHLLSNYETMLKENEMLKSEVNSLTEKLEAKGENGPCPRSGPIQLDPVDRAQISAQQQLSSGSSGASVVVNEENPQLVVDSGDSTYFDCPSPHLHQCITTVQSKEDDISDDDQSCFSRMFTHVVVNHQEDDEIEGQDLGLWIWP